MTEFKVEDIDTLSELFTAFIRFDKNMRIVHLSPLLGRYAPEIRAGMKFQDAFELVRPRRFDAINFQQQLKMIFLIISKESRYPIRGQVVELSDESFVLCGSPWLSRMTEDQIHQYEFKDFPLHDAQLDWLFILSAKKQQVSDLERLSQDLELQRAKAERAVESKSDFFAVMSHEMRTPLNAIIGSINLMPRDEMSREQTDLLEIAVSAALQLLSVINDVLDYSKMEAGKLELELSEFDIANIVHDVTTIVNPIASAKGLELLEEKGDILHQKVLGDNGKIKQILLNFLTNAIKFTEKGSVQLEVLQHEVVGNKTNFEFKVIDTGIGVSEEDKERLFEQFWTSSNYRGFQGRGTGLGLDIAKRMSHLMDGEIRFESVKGKGSTFSVVIPLECLASDTRRNTKLSSDSKLEINLLAGKRILVAEDNQANQIIARLTLEKMGIVVDIANNGIEVIEAINRAPYDAILMDIGMPEMNGIDATRKIRKELKMLSLPIIACTAHSRSMTADACDVAGFTAYVGKPIDRTELLRVLIDNLVDKRETTNLVQATEFAIDNQRLESIALINLKELEKLRSDIGEENMLAALNALNSELESRQNNLREACEYKNFKRLSEEAHALKSSSASFGAARLTGLVKQLEEQALASDPKAFKLAELIISTTAETRLAYSKI
tara:strand:- start:32816 stop:34816 length:2001 start_codon:yes stop_codon:yes gene_type:complete